MFDHQVVPIATLPMVAHGLAKPSPVQGYHPLTTVGPATMETLSLSLSNTMAAVSFPTQQRALPYDCNTGPSCNSMGQQSYALAMCLISVLINSKWRDLHNLE